MKRIISVFMVVAIMANTLVGCGVNNTQQVEQTENKNIKIVTTIFPIYDWVKNVLGDKFDKDNVSILLDNSVDLHNYQPTSADIVKISNSDLFIYVGGESDEWVSDVLNQVNNKNLKAISLMEMLENNLRLEEEKEGMESDHEHEHEKINESDIKDRTLSEFIGKWKSIHPMLQNGDLDGYVTEHSKEHNEGFDEVKNELLENWNTDIDHISINNDSIIFEKKDGSTLESKYDYKGSSIIKDEDGDIINVRYKFESKEGNSPRYVEFNDHNYAPVDKVEHFHIYVGDDSFDALDSSNMNPYFVADTATKDIIIEQLLHHEHDEEHDEEYDEHVWLSLKNVEKLIPAILNVIKELDADNANIYETNANLYLDKVKALDSDYSKMANTASNKMLIFGDRFPFLYMTKDYGLDYYAAFKGCSAETEASFKTIVFLTQKLDEYNLDYIMTIEGTNHKIAETIIENSKDKNRTILELNSMQSITSNDINLGVDYLDIMRKNLDILQKIIK